MYFNILGHVLVGVGEEYKLTGFRYTLISFTVLLWSLELVPFGLPARSEFILVLLPATTANQQLQLPAATLLLTASSSQPQLRFKGLPVAACQ